VSEGDSNPNLLFTRQRGIVQGVLASAVLAAQVGWVVQLVSSCRPRAVWWNDHQNDRHHPLRSSLAHLEATLPIDRRTTRTYRGEPPHGVPQASPVTITRLDGTTVTEPPQLAGTSARAL
jgi:hypothetical protein